jgi:hypothetical protein
MSHTIDSLKTLIAEMSTSFARMNELVSSLEKESDSSLVKSSQLALVRSNEAFASFKGFIDAIPAPPAPSGASGARRGRNAGLAAFGKKSVSGPTDSSTHGQTRARSKSARGQPRARSKSAGASTTTEPQTVRAHSKSAGDRPRARPRSKSASGQPPAYGHRCTLFKRQFEKIPGKLDFAMRAVHGIMSSVLEEPTDLNDDYYRRLFVGLKAAGEAFNDQHGYQDNGDSTTTEPQTARGRSKSARGRPQTARGRPQNTSGGTVDDHPFVDHLCVPCPLTWYEPPTAPAPLTKKDLDRPD